MTVRDSLLAVLTLGPAYGFQLHAELASRTPHRGPVNVGQIYTTLDRLTAQKLLRSHGETADGLPLHTLTDSGLVRASEWMHTADTSTLPEWTDMLDQIIVTATIRPDSAADLVRGFRAWWTAERASGVTEPTPEAQLAGHARLRRADSALSFLDDVDASILRGAPGRPYSAVKPKRGRRPSAAA